ncbi:MAG: PIN domain-containing protein [Gammaproteobacteria bacterium]
MIFSIEKRLYDHRNDYSLNGSKVQDHAKTGVSRLEVECLRALDRLRLAQRLGDDEVAVRREAAFRLIEAMEVVEITRPVLARAAQPLPTSLGTLDAIHLATALQWRELTGADLAYSPIHAIMRNESMIM